MNRNRSIEPRLIKWVLREMAPLLSDVQCAVAKTIESPEHFEPMEGVLGTLRKIQGTVHMLELYGADILAREMRCMVEELREGNLSHRGEALEVMMRAALQLSDYLESIKAGSRDVPLELLPLLNDLRAARGEVLLSEAVLSVPDLSPGDAATITREEDDEFTGVLRGLRLPFMQALLEWFKDAENVHSLARLSKLLHEIENAAHCESSRKIWPICRALVESLQDKGLSTGVSIKFLLAQVERLLKRLLERGESEIIRELPVDLIKNLLYYVARSTSQSPVVVEIRRVYRLGEMLPQRDQLEQARRIHQEPSIELLKIANQGVRDDISKIKVLLEQYQRAEDRNLSMLDPLDDLLRRVGDTLSVLGIGEPGALLEAKRKEIRGYLSREEDPGDALLVDIAAILLKVEDMPEGHIADQTKSVVSEPAPLSEDNEFPSLQDLPAREYQPLIESIVQESLRAFARIEQVFIDHSTQSANAHHIKRAPGLLNEVVGAFEILSNDTLVLLLTDLSTFFTSRYMLGGVVPDQFEQQLIAEVTTCIEYYLESIPDDGGREREYILGVSRSALDQLIALDDSDASLRDWEVAADRVGDPASATENVDRFETDPGQESTADGVPLGAIDKKILEVDIEAPPPSDSQPAPLPDGDELGLDSPDEIPATDSDDPESPVADIADEESADEVRVEAPATRDGEVVDSGSVEFDEGDGELRKIFIEEAEELLNASALVIDQWRKSPQDIQFYSELKRRLHTLKGGARMAGYPQMADLTHALESSIVTREAAGETPTERYFDLMQETVDALAINLEQARSEREMGRFDWIVSDLHTDVDHPAVQPASGSRDANDFEASLKLTTQTIEDALVEHTTTQKLSPARQDKDQSNQHIRVRSELLDNLVNHADEVNVYHTRVGQQICDMGISLSDLDQTVTRLRGQLQLMDRETEEQISRGHDQSTEGDNHEFDPLELDRYSQIQGLSRSLLESVADLEDITGTLTDLTRDSETVLLQQSRVTTELQEGLLRTRMVRFDGIEARLSRVVRQTAQSLKKKASLTIAGGENEIDRGVQERMIAPLEHLLRNAVAHGIESPGVRSEAGKPSAGKIAVRLSLDGGEILIRVVDDGAGIDAGAVRRTAIERNLIDSGVELDDREILHLLFDSGFSTAQQVTQIAGRGIGLDVVGREIKQLGGSVTLESEAGIGTMFVIRLPQMLAISQVLLVKCAGDIYAMPVIGIRGISRENIADLGATHRDMQKQYVYAGEEFQLIQLTRLLQVESSDLQPTEQVPLIMVRSGEKMVAVQVDEMIGRREIVVKHPGAQASTVPGIIGATLLGDGRVVIVLDIGGLLQTLERDGIARELSRFESPPESAAGHESSKPSATVLIVDDSITIRKGTARLLERNNIEVLTAKDGADAVVQLEQQMPDLILLDIEMPRMDGFEVAGFIRNDPRFKDLPIIIITSRSGDKSRQRAQAIGIDRYLGKPYQEMELIELIADVLGREFTSN